jgi:hypothetical protein
MLGISLVAEQVLAAQERLGCVDSVRWLGLHVFSLAAMYYGHAFPFMFHFFYVPGLPALL